LVDAFPTEIALGQWDETPPDDVVAVRQMSMHATLIAAGVADDGTDNPDGHEEDQNFHSLITVPSARHRRTDSNPTVMGARLASMRSCRAVSPAVKLTW
jgi:hypothetical protein